MKKMNTRSSICWTRWIAVSVTVWILCLHVGGCAATDVYINQFAVHVEGGQHVANRVARETGMVNLGQIGSLDDHYLFEVPHRERRSASPSHDHHRSLRSHSQVHWFEQQVAKSRVKRDFHPRDVTEQMSVDDPYWKNQWYLHGGAYGGFDMNVFDAWRKGFTGKNIVVTILDDGLEHSHSDLQRNYDPYASHDVNDNDPDPMPRYNPSNENRHGTRCAGEVSAEANNTHCTIGIAPDSKIGGIRMLDGEVYDAVEAASLSFNRTHIDIYSASWGPDDDGKVVDGPGKLAKKAFINGIQSGRNGKGSIFVWASGNGGSAQDSCNCDGYANSIFTLSISSTSENGVKPWYLEECSSTLATTYSSGAYNEKQIASTDLHNRCTTTHTGTSASAPLAAGMLALVLEANKDLTWRDVQYITLMTARQGPIRDGQWVTNGLGRKVSLRYGYGLMDASAMVDLALVWNNVPQKHECNVESSVDNEQLVAHETYSTELTTDGCKGTALEVNYLEHVQAKISLTYQRRGDIVIYLTSPSGTRSKLLPHRPSDINPGGFDDWPFLSVHFWGENPTGKWKLEIEDADTFNSRMGGGNLLKWSLVFHGTQVQPVNLKNQTTAGASKPATGSSTTTTTTTTTVDKGSASPSKTTSKPSYSGPCHSECDGACTGPGANECNKCKHLQIGINKQCTDSCPEEYYRSGDMCLICDMTCRTCSGPLLTNCMSCKNGHHLQKLQESQQVCSSECLSGYFHTDVESTACSLCHDSCYECSGSATSCTSCNHGRVLKGDKCIPGKTKSMSTVMSENVALVAVLISLIILFVAFITLGLVLSYKNGYLCWASWTPYRPVPPEDRDAVVSLTYSDDLDDDYGA